MENIHRLIYLLRRYGEGRETSFGKSSSHIFPTWPSQPHRQAWLLSLFQPDSPGVSKMGLTVRKIRLKKKLLNFPPDPGITYV